MPICNYLYAHNVSCATGTRRWRQLEPITGINIPDLFIIPWSKNEEERLAPENGICLSPLYDIAYDKGYIAINEKFTILLSHLSQDLIKKHHEGYHAKYFAPIAGTKIILPKKYYPKKEFLQFHLDEVFRGEEKCI